VLEEIGEVVGGDQVVDADEFDVGILHANPEEEAADAAETVNTHLQCHDKLLLANRAGKARPYIFDCMPMSRAAGKPPPDQPRKIKLAKRSVKATARMALT
jgi:hypothetical protein